MPTVIMPALAPVATTEHLYCLFGMTSGVAYEAAEAAAKETEALARIGWPPPGVLAIAVAAYGYPPDFRVPRKWKEPPPVRRVLSLAVPVAKFRQMADEGRADTERLDNASDLLRRLGSSAIWAVSAPAGERALSQERVVWDLAVTMARGGHIEDVDRLVARGEKLAVILGVDTLSDFIPDNADLGITSIFVVPVRAAVNTTLTPEKEAAR